MVTIKDMAEKAGVCPTTVSNVLHGRTNKVSQETLEKVQRVIAESKYVSNMGARLLANNGSRIIGVIMNYERREDQNAIQDPFYSELIGSLEREIRNQGYFMMLYTAKNIAESLKLASAWNVEGLIMVGTTMDGCAKLKRNTDKPVVFIDCYFHNDDIIYTNVGLQDRRGGYQMTKYLIGQGHRRIAFLADSDDPVGVDRERFEGYKAALNEEGIGLKKEDYIYISFDKKERMNTFEDICSNRINEYTALFFSSDFYAVDAIHYFMDKNISVPKDISIVGFDDNVFARQCRPKLTTVRQNVTNKAKYAVSQMKDLILGNSLDEYDIKLPIEIIVRDSVKNLNQK